ncbi:hypothetical protein Esti_002167 [Eimeria stiedai]
MVNLGKVVLPENKGLLDLFWQLTEASPKRRTQAACDLVHYLLRERKAEDAPSGGAEAPAQSQPPGVAAVDAQKVHNMLSAHKEGSVVPYDMQYAVNRLFQGLASPRPCTRQAYALALLLLLQQLQQQDPPGVRVNLSAFCQNLGRVFALKQAALSEVKQLHLGRCLGVYVLLCLNFFRRKHSFPEVKDVFEMLWEAFNGKVQLQEASGFLIRQVLRQLTEAGEGQLGLEACERRLRGIVTPQLLAQLEKVDRSKVTELGKTATGRLPYSLLEVYVRLQADMQEGLIPEATWLQTDLFRSENLPSIVKFLSDTAAAHPRLHGLWDGVMRLLLLRSDAEEVFSRLWAAVDSKLFLSKARALHGVDTAQKKAQEQSQQSAFLGFRALLLAVQLLKQRLLSLATTKQSTSEALQLQRMATTVFEKGKGFIRVLLVHLESPRSPLHGVARFTIERLQEIFSHPGHLGVAHGHFLATSLPAGNRRNHGVLKAQELSSLCLLGCGCQADPYIHGLLEPVLRATRNEAEHARPFGAQFETILEPLPLKPEQRVSLLLVFGAACRFHPLKRQSFWRLTSICFSSTGPDELEGVAMQLLAALNEAPAETSAVPEEHKGLMGRRRMWLLDSLLILPQLHANKVADGVNPYFPDWLLSAILCSCAFTVRIVPAKKQRSHAQFYAAAIKADEMSEAPRATVPDGMDDLIIPVKSLQLPRLVVFGFDSHVVNDSQQMVGNEHSADSAARSRLQGKLCSLLGSFCVAAMESSTRTEGVGASNYARQMHRAHAQLYQLMQRETSLGESNLQLQARSIGCGERKVTVFLSSRSGSSAVASELQDTGGLEAFAFFASSQGAALAATAQAAVEQQKSVHKGFVAAAQVLSVALCTVSLLPYLLVKGQALRGMPEDAQVVDDDGTEVDETKGELETCAAIGSVATAFANSGMKPKRNAFRDDFEELLETWLHALRVMLEVAKPLYAYLRKCGDGQKDAAVASQTKLAAISSTLLLIGGNSAPSGLVREVAGGLWQCFSCFASSTSITRLLQVASASACSPDDVEEHNVEEEPSESEEVSGRDESSSDESEQETSEQEEEPRQKRQKLDAGGSSSDHSDKADEAQSSSDKSDDDPFAVQLSPDAALKTLADDTALPDAYHPPEGFRERGQSQRKLILRQRRRFGELRLRALAALQVFVQFSSSSPLALHVLTSLYGTYSHALLQAAQSRKRKQKLLVYDDLANKIRRTIDLALKGATGSAWLGNKAASSECNGRGKPHRKGSSIRACYQELQEQHLQALLQGARSSYRGEDGVDVVRFPPLMPTLEDGDSMQLFLEGKKSASVFCEDGEATEKPDTLTAPGGGQLFVSRCIWALLAEEMANVLRICSRKLPPLLANQNQALGVEILLQLHKLEQQIYQYHAQNRDQATSLVCNGEMILPQFLSVALAARSQVRRCHLGWRFFEAVADRRPELFRFCDVYGSALMCRAPFVRRKLAQLALRVYKHPNVYSPVSATGRSHNSDFQAFERRLSLAFVLRNLLAKEGGNKAAGWRRVEAACNCELVLIPSKALKSGSSFLIFVVRRLVELLKQTSDSEVREEEQKEPQSAKQPQKGVVKRGSYGDMEVEEEADGGKKQPLQFSSAAQKQAAIRELLKQLQQLLQAFIRRDWEPRPAAKGARHHKGFKEKLQVQIPSVQEIVQDAALTAGGKKPSILASTIGSVLSRTTPTCIEGPTLPRHRPHWQRQTHRWRRTFLK